MGTLPTKEASGWSSLRLGPDLLASMPIRNSEWDNGTRQHGMHLGGTSLLPRLSYGKPTPY